MEEIIYTFAAIGMTITFVLFVSTIYYCIFPKLQKFLSRKCKVRFLCKHDYVKTFDFVCCGQMTIEIECKNCGKKKTITFKNE